MSNVEDTSGVPGAQVIRRAAVLMRLVGERMSEGMPISELVERTGLKRPTVHRLLLALADEGLIEQDPETRKWRLGEETYILGTIAGVRHNAEALAKATIFDIAEQSGDTTFFSVRTGMNVVALLCEEGSYPIRTHVLQTGDRWPMGVGAASLAMMARMADSELNAILDYNKSAYDRFPSYPVVRIRELVEETRQKGYSMSRGLIVQGSWGMGAVVLDAVGQPTMAINVTGIESRISGDREKSLGKLLVEKSLKLTEMIKAGRSAKGA